MEITQWWSSLFFSHVILALFLSDLLYFCLLVLFSWIISLKQEKKNKPKTFHFSNIWVKHWGGCVCVWFGFVSGGVCVFVAGLFVSAACSTLSGGEMKNQNLFSFVCFLLIAWALTIRSRVPGSKELKLCTQMTQCNLPNFTELSWMSKLLLSFGLCFTSVFLDGE